MRWLKVKTFVCLIWIFLTAAFFFVREVSPVKSQTNNTKFSKHPKPEKSLIERFDKSIQARFLTEPSFGISRITPPNPHLTFFNPINDEERQSVADFEKEGWKVAVYLFGRRATPKDADDMRRKGFDISYRLNDPLPVTSNLKQKEMPKAGELLEKVKSAFLEFQTPNSSNENNFEFNEAEWSYVAKPVRAVESCLKCHTDYVMTEKIANNKYKFRKRQVGDANGVLVYGFTKNN